MFDLVGPLYRRAQRKVEQDVPSQGLSVGVEAAVPLQLLRDAPWPTLVISGTWKDAPELYRTYVGEPLMACADAVATAAGGHLLHVPGYYPHTQQPAMVNAALCDLWEEQAARTLSTTIRAHAPIKAPPP